MKVNKFVKGFAAIALSSLVLAACGADKKDNTTNSSSAASSETKNQRNHQHQRKSCRWRFKRWYV